MELEKNALSKVFDLIMDLHDDEYQHMKKSDWMDLMKKAIQKYLSEADSVAREDTGPANHQGVTSAVNLKLLSAALAFKTLNTCYRLGKKPSEELFQELCKAENTLEDLKLTEQARITRKRV